MRIGILGGTFDPVHNGHLHLAREVSRKLKLSKIIFIPTYLPPHKQGAGIATAMHRCNMLRLATRNRKGFQVSGIEIKRKGRSYSVETLRQLKKRYGARQELYFITGSDSSRYRWKNLSEILRLCRFIVVKRPGFSIKTASPRLITMDIKARDISSTDIRRRVKRGLAITNLVPKAVALYIDKHGLYLARA
ncbi:MAG: nicotinate-nucleotide adenylyltransferase [Candidatus Omnitrophica bacterium]|nr:nicotinate-nucleotide adenylyltransferase [Candidatus Omnitrophota bacterium]MBU4589367.1 nicotinate-nucleotide adenylyltransferase [Candidatus Omnitrophota bacterium]